MKKILVIMMLLFTVIIRNVSAQENKQGKALDDREKLTSGLKAGLNLSNDSIHEEKILKQNLNWV